MAPKEIFQPPDLLFSRGESRPLASPGELPSVSGRDVTLPRSPLAPIQPDAIFFPELKTEESGEKPLYAGFLLDKITFRRKVFSLFGGQYKGMDAQGNEVFYARQKPFRLREAFTVFPSKERTDPVLTFSTRQIVDDWATYTVTDPQKENQEIGKIKRKWPRSILRDTWELEAAHQQSVGKMEEERSWKSRLLPAILAPQRYRILDATGKEVANIRQSRNPLVLTYDMEIVDPHTKIDRRLLIASGILLAGIEKRQQRWRFSFSSRHA